MTTKKNDVDEQRVVAAVREMLTGLGYDVDDPAIVDTPKRVAKAMQEMTIGDSQKPEEVLKTQFDAERYDEIVLLRDIAFYSLCEHHLLPFHGRAHVAYVPGSDGRVVGLSKLARLVEMHARRLQLQERMTAGIATDLETVLKARGVAVIVEGQHMCMCSRGVGKPGATMTTSVMRGCFRAEPAARAELMMLIRR